MVSQVPKHTEHTPKLDENDLGWLTTSLLFSPHQPEQLLPSEPPGKSQHGELTAFYQSFKAAFIQKPTQLIKLSSVRGVLLFEKYLLN